MIKKQSNGAIIDAPFFHEKSSLHRELNRSTTKGRYKVEINLKKEDEKIIFSASGDYPHGGGQCLDFMNDTLQGDILWDKIYRLWKLYHLNDMNAGTIKQDRLIEMGIRSGELKSRSYDEVCEFLENWDLLYDDWYKYGSKWLYRPIPEQDLFEIFTLFVG